MPVDICEMFWSTTCRDDLAIAKSNGACCLLVLVLGIDVSYCCPGTCHTVLHLFASHPLLSVLLSCCLCCCGAAVAAPVLSSKLTSIEQHVAGDSGCGWHGSWGTMRPPPIQPPAVASQCSVCAAVAGCYCWFFCCCLLKGSGCRQTNAEGIGAVIADL